MASTLQRTTDETTICEFRHLLEKDRLGEPPRRAVNEHLQRNGSIVDASTIGDAWQLGLLTERCARN